MENIRICLRKKYTGYTKRLTVFLENKNHDLGKNLRMSIDMCW